MCQNEIPIFGHKDYKEPFWYVDECKDSKGSQLNINNIVKQIGSHQTDLSIFDKIPVLVFYF